MTLRKFTIKYDKEVYITYSIVHFIDFLEKHKNKELSITYSEEKQTED